MQNLMPSSSGRPKRMPQPMQKMPWGCTQSSLRVLAGAAASAAYIDVGFCAPDLDVSGRTWAGWQGGKAWLFRGYNGLFKGDASATSQGQPRSEQSAVSPPTRSRSR